MLHRFGLWAAVTTGLALLAPTALRAQTPAGPALEPHPRIFTITATADTAFVAIGQSVGFASWNKVPYKLVGFGELTPGTPAADMLIVSPSSSISPSQLVIGLNPNVVPYLFPGRYDRTVLFAPVDSPAEVAAVLVSVFLKNSGRPEIASVVGSTTKQPVLSPGAWVSVSGKHLSTPPITAQANTAGLYPTTLGNSQVTFNGIPAPLLYVSNDRIDCIVPFGVSSGETIEVVVIRLQAGQASPFPSEPVTLPLQPTSPGMFTVDQSGSGAAIIENVDSVNQFLTTPNSESNPASVGSTIRLRATGVGMWNFPLADGAAVLSIAGSLAGKSYNPVAPVGTISLFIGGQSATLLHVSPAVGYAAGMLQIDAAVPEGIGPGAQPIVLKIGDYDNSQQNTTVWVQ